MNVNKKIILGIVGEMAAGKTTLTAYLKKKYNAQTFRFSDMLRDVATRMHLKPDRENLQKISTVFRQNFSEDIMSKVIAKDVAKAEASFIITEGVRRPTDVTYLKELSGYFILALATPEKLRYQRLHSRTENIDDQTKTWEQFQKDGEQEAEQKIKEIMAEANFTIDNSGTLEELYQKADEIIVKIKD